MIQGIMHRQDIIAWSRENEAAPRARDVAHAALFGRKFPRTVSEFPKLVIGIAGADIVEATI